MEERSVCCPYCFNIVKDWSWVKTKEGEIVAACDDCAAEKPGLGFTDGPKK
jgi:NAD-dependent SIR2 family protein deacetylase